MKTMALKVNDKIMQELELIKDTEGLGNKTATFTFLVKYYFLTKKNSLEYSLRMLDKLLDTVDVDNLPSLRDQLKDL